MRSRLKELRIRAGMTQVELADRAGLTQSTVSKIELGRGDGDGATLRALASALGVNVADLTAEDADTPPATAAHDAAVIPSLDQRPGWSDVLARAKSDAPDIESDDWDTLAKSPGLFAFDVPLTPALLVELARVVRRHRPPKK